VSGSHFRSPENRIPHLCRANAFDKVCFLSGGGSDAAALYDSPGSDRLETGSDWVSLASPGQWLYRALASDA
jgi:hypothetical protein